MAYVPQSFKGYSGTVVLDLYGDREPDFWITDMDPDTGAFVKIAEIKNYDLGVRVSALYVFNERVKTIPQ